MVRLTVSLLLCVCIGVASGVTLAEWGPLGAQIPGSSNITLLKVSSSLKLPKECRTTPCFPKCCPFGERLENKKCTPTNYTFNPVYTPGDSLFYSIFDEPSDPFYMIIGEICFNERYSFSPDEFALLYNGTMVLGMKDNGTFIFNSDEDSRFLPNQYCLDVNVTNNNVSVVAVFCDETQKGGMPIHVVVSVGLLLSVCFLLMTMVVYLGVPDLRDLQGMSLVCHLSCQALAYLFLAAVQLSNGGFGETGCRVVAYIIQLLFSGSFFWLNVMCFDAMWCVVVATLPQKHLEEEAKWWWKLHYPGAKKWVKVGNEYMAGRDERGVEGDAEHKRKERRVKMKIFMVYSLYAWFFSILPTVLVLLKGFGPSIPNTYLQYTLVSYNCDFEALSDTNSQPYFYIPVGTVLILNTLMFILTVVKSCRYQWNPKGPHRIPRQKARMCYLLFFIMGVTWLTDIIYWNSKIAMAVLNVFNILQGLVTFFIFVFEDRVKLLILTKLWPCMRNLKAKYCCQAHQPPETDGATENTCMLNYKSMDEK